MADLAVTPVQTNNGNSNNVGLTVGAAAIGALGGGSMYFKTPSEDAFVKSGLKLSNKEFAKQADTLTTALKEITTGEKKLSTDTIEALKTLGLTSEQQLSESGIKDTLKQTIGKISDQKVFDKAKAAANDVVAGTVDDAVKVAEKAGAETRIKGLYEAAKQNISKSADDLTGEAKKGVEIFKKAKSAAALKWGGIAAAALAILTAGYLYMKNDNSDAAEQPTQTEKA